MLRFLILAILLAGAGKVCACEREWYGLNTMSHHFSDRKYNEDNWGPFYECRHNPSWALQTGYYRNSYDLDSFYISEAYQPLRYGPLRAGGFLGIVTGYRNKQVSSGGNKYRTVPVGGFTGFGGLIFSYEHDHIGANIVWLPTVVVSLQIKVGF